MDIFKEYALGCDLEDPDIEKVIKGATEAMNIDDEDYAFKNLDIRQMKLETFEWFSKKIEVLVNQIAYFNIASPEYRTQILENTHMIKPTKRKSNKSQKNMTKRERDKAKKK